MRKQLDGLRWESCWMTEVGCLKGGLAHLGIEITWPHLYGLTATAFVMNMHAEACPSSPTAWRSAELISALLPNLGAQAEFALGGTDMGNLAEAQAHAWELTRRYLDAGLPVYGWELGVPEYYVIHGYDHVGYYYNGPGCEDGAGPKPWQELAATDIGVVCVAGLKPCQRATTKAAVIDALDAAVRLAQPDNPWRLEHYTTGPAAYEVWANALASGLANEFGHRYCASVWAECRHNAVRFLTEMADSLEGEIGEAAAEALAAYKKVNVLLGTVAQEHVYLPPGQIAMDQTLQSAESASMLRQAGEAEAEGVRALRKLVAALQA